MNVSIVNSARGMVKELSWLLTQINSEMGKEQESNHTISVLRSSVLIAINDLIKAEICLKKIELIYGKKPTETQSDGSF